MNELTLYDRTTELLAIQASIERYEDLTPEEAEQLLDQAVAAYFTENKSEIEKKVDGYVYKIKMEEAKGKAVKAEEDVVVEFYKARRRPHESQAKRMKEALERFLKTAGLDSMPGEDGGAFLQSSPPAVDIVDASLVPSEYWINPTLDKERAKADMQLGKEIPGLALTRGKHLRIR